MPKIILITGASTGFGRDTAETLARAGHTVFASMRNPQEKNRDHAETLRKQGIEVIELDVTSDASVDRAVKAVLTRAKRIDVLINNAGIASAGVTEAFTADQTKIVFNTNVVGLLRTTRAVLPAMRRPPRITRVDRAQLHPQRRRYGLSGGELADPRGDNMPPNWPRSRRMFLVAATGTATVTPLLQATRTVPIVFVRRRGPASAARVGALPDRDRLHG